MRLSGAAINDDCSEHLAWTIGLGHVMSHHSQCPRCAAVCACRSRLFWRQGGVIVNVPTIGVAGRAVALRVGCLAPVLSHGLASNCKICTDFYPLNAVITHHNVLYGLF